MRKKHITWQWLSAAIISLLMFSTPALAGNLNPSAPPGPTMKTLDQAPSKDEVIPPWSQALPASERFKLVMMGGMGGEAVLDRETGLVWQRSPWTNTNTWDWTWTGNAQFHCAATIGGGRLGWRVPTVQELGSLMDVYVSDSPKLPSGHPFVNVQSGFYWTSTPVNGRDMIYVVGFGEGSVMMGSKSNAYYTWCVRGGQGS